METDAQTVHVEGCLLTCHAGTLPSAAHLPLYHNTLASSSFLSPPFRVADMNESAESLIHLSCCVLAFASLIPQVATVQFPPQNNDLSNNTTLPLFPNTVLAADVSV